MLLMRGYNIVTDQIANEKEKLTIHLNDVQIDQAINLVVRAPGLSYEIIGKFYFSCKPS